MKICMIDEIANCAYHLTSGLTKKGHEVHVLLDVQRRVDRLLFTHHIPKSATLKWIRPLPIRPRALGLFLPLLWAILRIRPDVIHVQYLWSHFFIGYIAAKLLGIPIIGTGHGWEVLDVPREPIRGTIQRWFLKRADMIILTADYYHKSMEGIVSRERLIYIPRMIDTDMFRPDIPAKDLLAEYGDQIVTFVARLFKIKTPYKTINAFHKALTEVPNARLLILGIGPEENNMKKTVTELGIADRVHFLGEIPNPEIPRYLNASKVEARGFNPLTLELGISHLEALACGTPVLTYNDYPDVRGMIIVLHVDEIAEAMIRLLKDKEFQQKLGREGREYVIEKFSIEAGTEKTIQVYKKVLRQRGRS